MQISRTVVPLATIFLGLAIFTTVQTLPLSTESRLLATTDLAQKTVLLSPGHTLTQTYLAHGRQQSGISIYTTVPALTNQKLQVVITDEHNSPLAQGKLSRQSYLPADDTIILHYSFPWINTKPNQPLSLQLTLAQGNPLPLRQSAKNTYGPGELTLNNNFLIGDLSLATIHPSPLSFGARQGVTAAITLAILFSLIITYLPKQKQWWATGLLLATITPLALFSFMSSQHYLGIADWDLYFSYHEVIRRTLLDYHVFPFWNPWLCGGTAALGDPEFPLFTLTFLLELIFGIPLGFALAIFLSIATTAVGMLLLAKRLHLSLPASLLAALAGAYGSVSILEIVEGHPNVFAAMWIPWIFWAWLAAYQTNPNGKSSRLREQIPRVLSRQTNAITSRWHGGEKLLRRWQELISGTLSRRAKRKRSEAPGFKKFDSSPSSKQAKQTSSAAPRLEKFSSPQAFNIWPLLCGIFLALTFYAGGIYLLMYTTLAFIFLTLLVSQPLIALRTTIMSGLWGLGLASLKLFPVLFWLGQFQDKDYASSATTLPFLKEILFGRHLHGSNIVFDQASGWHEYGAYIGYFVFALALIGLSQIKKSRLVRTLAIAALAAILLSAAGPALEPYFDQLPFFPRSNISRFILFAIIPLSLLAGFGLEIFNNKLQKIKLLRVTRRGSPAAPQQAESRNWSPASAERNSGAGRCGPVGAQAAAGPVTILFSVVIILIVALDLFSLSYQLSEQAFVLPNVARPPQKAPYPIAYTTQHFDPKGSEARTTRSYAAIKQGYGTLTYCSVLGPDPMIRTIHDEVDNDIILAQPKPESLELTDWNPNQAAFHIINSQPTKLILNANYATGWYVNNQPAVIDSGRVATSVPPGDHQIKFKYKTAGFKIGLAIALFTLALAAYQVYFYDKDKHANKT